MSNFDSWFATTFKGGKTRPTYEEAIPILSTISPLLSAINEGFTEDNDYWKAIEQEISKAIPSDPCPKSEDFTSFAQFIFDHLEQLNPTTVEGMKQLLFDVDTSGNSFRPIWDFAECIKDPQFFLKTLCSACKQCNKKENSKFNLSVQVIEMLFDHYSPMLEATNLMDNTVLIDRMDLAEALVTLSYSFPYAEDETTWNPKTLGLFRIMSRISTKTVGFISIHTFRLACQLYSRDFKRMSKKQQADELLRFVQRFPQNHLMRVPAIRFAIIMHPEEFGFVSLAKAIIQGGIVDQNELHLISKILNLKYVKNPTDVYIYLFNCAASHKILASCARYIICKTIQRYLGIQELQDFIKEHIKRLICLIAYSHNGNTAKRRMYLALREVNALRELNVDWITELIDRYVASSFEYAHVPHDFFNFTLSCGPNPEDQELFNVQASSINLKNYIENGTNTQNTANNDASASGTTSSRASQRSGKPTIAEVKARYRNAMAKGQYTPANDLSLLKNQEEEQASEQNDP